MFLSFPKTVSPEQLVIPLAKTTKYDTQLPHMTFVLFFLFFWFLLFFSFRSVQSISSRQTETCGALRWDSQV